MPENELQSLCEQGQWHLEQMRYLEAEAALVRAEQLALRDGDFDTLARLYMPLQESRRQRRLICAEGTVQLDLLPESPSLQPDAAEIARRSAQGQLLAAGWGSIAPGIELRRIATEKQLYLEAYLAAIYPIAGGGRAVAVVPTADVALPPPLPVPIDVLIRKLPPHSIVMNADELPTGPRRGDAHTLAWTMSLWERLHLPFLAQADQTKDLKQRIAAYRRTIGVDYACELAHQKLSAAAHEIARMR